MARGHNHTHLFLTILQPTLHEVGQLWKTLSFRRTKQLSRLVLTQALRCLQVLQAPGESEHLDFVNRTTSYEEQLQSAGKAYLDWHMLRQVHMGVTIYLMHGRPPMTPSLARCPHTCEHKDSCSTAVADTCVEGDDLMLTTSKSITCHMTQRH